MKKTDIATLILVVSVVALIVYFTIKLLIGDASNKPVNVETAKPITAEVTKPSPAIFNEQAINPTIPITIQGGDQKPIGN